MHPRERACPPIARRAAAGVSHTLWKKCGPCKKESVHVNRTDKVSTNLVTVALRKARIAVSDAAWRKNNPEYHSEYSKSCTLNLPLPQTCCVGYRVTKLGQMSN